MQRVAFQTVLREAAGLAGFTLAQLTSTPKTQFRTFINRRTREYWDHWWWNQIMHAEERFYRPDYDAGTTYDAGDEVYYPTTGKYYVAILEGTGNAPTNTTYWEEAGDDFDPYILLEQDDERAIGTVRMMSVDNPLKVRNPRSWPFRPMGDQLQVLGEDVPASLYVWFREPAPNWLGDDFDAAETYAAGEVVYYEGTGADFEGDFWTCLASTTAGQDPEDTPAKWERIDYPAWLRSPAAQAAYADWIRQDGGVEAAKLEDSEAQRLLLKAIHRDGPAQRQLTRSSGA